MDNKKEFERVLSLAIEDAYRVAFKEPQPDPAENSAFLRYIVGAMEVRAREDGAFRVLLRSNFVKNGFLSLGPDGAWETSDLEGSTSKKTFPVSAEEAMRIARQMVGGEPRPDATKTVAGFAKKLAKRKVEQAISLMQEDALPPVPDGYLVWDDYINHGFSLNEEESVAHSIFCGRHSGFRECCIRFFCNEWSHMTGRQRDAYMDMLRGRYKDLGSILCTDCFEQGRKSPRAKKCRCNAIFGGAFDRWKRSIRKALAEYRKNPDTAALQRAIDRAKKDRAEALSKVR